MQGEVPARQLGRGNKGNMEIRAGRWIPCSPLFQNKILTIYSRTHFVVVFHTKKQETSEGRRGPSFLHGGPGRLEVADGVGRRLAWPQGRGGGCSPCYASEEVTQAPGKFFLLRKQSRAGEAWGSGPWRLSHRGSHTFLTAGSRPNLADYFVFFNLSHKSLKDKFLPRPMEFLWK